MRFRPYDQVTVSNIVVDGSPRDNTLLTLSHWPKSGTPPELKADTSAEIALKVSRVSEVSCRKRDCHQ